MWRKGRGNVNRVNNGNLKDERYKRMEVNVIEMISFIDVAEKKNLKFIKGMYRLKGFGNCYCEAVGKRTLLITIDGLDIEVEVLIVPEDAQEDAIMVRMTAIFANMMGRLIRFFERGVLFHFFNDLLMPSREIAEGMIKLGRVLQALEDTSITQRLEKFKYFETKIDFLGYEIAKKGMCPQLLKISAVQYFKRPEDAHEIRQFCGLASSFRKFVPNFTMITAPLT